MVTTVMSNFGLYKAFDEKGIGYVKTAVGDKYVYEYMSANGCRLGGEQSAHIIISKYATTGDDLLTSLKIMEVMLAKKKSDFHRDGQLIRLTTDRIEDWHRRISSFLEISPIAESPDAGLKFFFFTGPEGYHFEIQQFTEGLPKSLFC